jgi:hypothetical protein
MRSDRHLHAAESRHRGREVRVADPLGLSSGPFVDLQAIWWAWQAKNVVMIQTNAELRLELGLRVRSLLSGVSVGSP